MRLFYRVTNALVDATVPENVDVKQTILSSLKQEEQIVSPINIKNEFKQTSPNNNENNDSQQQAKAKLNKSLIGQDNSVLGNIENKLISSNNKEETNTIENNKDTDDINNSINQTLNNTNATTATTTTTTTNNNNIHNTSNANDTSLTITSMVASINKEKKNISKPTTVSTSSPSSNNNNNNESNSTLKQSKVLTSSLLSLSSMQIEPVSHNDKENEDANLNSSILKQQQSLSETKKLLVNTSNLLCQNEVILAGNAIGSNTAQQQQVKDVDLKNVILPNIAIVTTSSNSNNHANKIEKLILPKLPITKSSSIVNDTTQPTESLLKPLKPKKQYNKTKKELLPKPTSNGGTESETNNLVSTSDGSSETIVTKKVKKQKIPNEPKQPKQPKKPKAEKTTTVKKEPKSNNNNNPAMVAPATTTNIPSNLQQAFLALQQQQQHHQQQQNNYFQQQQQQQQHMQSNFSLPFCNKIPIVSAPAASSTPAPSPLLQNNFQIMPMQSLMNSFYPWKQFEGYANTAANGKREIFYISKSKTRRVSVTIDLNKDGLLRFNHKENA